MQTADVIQVVLALLTFIALGLSGVAFFSTRQNFHRDTNHRLTDRVYEINKLIIEKPEITKFLFEKSFHTGLYFVTETPHDLMYFQAKAWIYFHLDFFDEICSVATGDTKLEQAIEFDSWKDWIIEKMKHPLYREIYERESKMWGENFKKFLQENLPGSLDKPKRLDPELL